MADWVAEQNAKVITPKDTSWTGTIADTGEDIGNAFTGHDSYQSGRYMSDQDAAGQDVKADLYNQDANLPSDRERLMLQATGLNRDAVNLNSSAQGISALSDQLGNAPSAADRAAKSAMSAQNAQAMSQAASVRGANSALMMREAQSNNDARDRQIAGDAAATSANEMNGRYATRAQMLASAAGVQNNAAGITSSAANVMNANAQNTLSARNQDLTAIQGANSINQQGFQSQQQIDADTAKHNAEGEQKAVGGIMTAIGGAFALSDMRAKQDIKKIEEDKSTNKTLTDLLARASGDFGRSLQGAPLDTGNVRRGFDRGALDAAQTRAGGRIYGSPSAAPAPPPTARFADYRPPTARFADAPPQMPAPVAAPAPAPAPAPPPPRANPGFDVAALDDAYRREGQQSYLLSDKDAKTDRQKLLIMAVSPAANRENLGEVDPYAYRYKPEVAQRIGEDTGPRPGIMAQELERAPAGKQVVSNTPEGKALDVNRALGFSLAGVAGLDKRLQRLEAAIGKGRGKAA